MRESKYYFISVEPASGVSSDLFEYVSAGSLDDALKEVRLHNPDAFVGATCIELSTLSGGKHTWKLLF